MELSLHKEGMMLYNILPSIFIKFFIFFIFYFICFILFSLSFLFLDYIFIHLALYYYLIFLSPQFTVFALQIVLFVSQNYTKCKKCKTGEACRPCKSCNTSVTARNEI